MVEPNYYSLGVGTAALYLVDSSQSLSDRVSYGLLPGTRFGLPERSALWAYSDMFSLSDTTPTTSNDDGPFAPDPAMRILTFYVVMKAFHRDPQRRSSASGNLSSSAELDNWDDVGQYYLHAHVGTFVRRHFARPGVNVPWDDWAPDARLLPHARSNSMISQ